MGSGAPQFLRRAQDECSGRHNAITVNGMRGSWRSARPARIALATLLGGDIDGAWRPHTASVASEPPELIQALHRLTGEITDISMNWLSTQGPPDLNSMSYERQVDARFARQASTITVIASRRARAKQLVVPHMTTGAGRRRPDRDGVARDACRAAIPVPRGLEALLGNGLMGE
jgi:hypothetical protein